MAEKIEDYAFPTRGRRSKHNWDKLLDGSIYRLVQGEDFECTTDSMRKMVYQRAWKRGGTAKTDMVEDGILIIQFKPKD